MKRRRPQKREPGTGARPPAPRTRDFGSLARAFVIALAVAAVYANSPSAPFIFDDEAAIVSNPAIRTLGGAWSQPRDTPLAGRPVAGLSFALNFAASDLDPAAYRATNITIHIACALVLFGLLRRTLTLPQLQSLAGGTAPDLAFAAALMWAVHPLTTDAVTYVTQRTESLMALCYVLTLYASMRANVRSTGWWPAAAIAACSLGMGVKESMVTAPVVVILFDRVFMFDSVRAAFAARGRLYAGLALTWVVLALQLSTAPRSGSAGFGTGVSMWTYLLNQCVMIVRYLRLALWPGDFAITYGAPVSYGLNDVLPQAAAVAALLLLTLAAFRWNRPVAFLGSWFFITLAPSSSFVPIATEVGAERRMYLPLMALTTIIVATFGAHLRRPVSRRLAIAMGVIISIALGAATVARNAEHQSWLTLAQTTLDRWPTDAAHAAVGAELSRLQRDEEALAPLRIGARSDARGRYNLGVTLFNLQQYDEAIRELEVLVRTHPMREEVPWARRVMGQSYMRFSKWPDAIAQLQSTLAMTPGDAGARELLVDAHNRFGVDLARKQRFGDAIDQFRHAVDHDDRNVSARLNLATALFDAGRMDESALEAERVIALNPTGADGYHLKGKLLALQGRRDDALALLQTAVDLRPDDSAIRDDLARVRRLR
jgi:Flp pilus assembly protein TadD